MKKQIVRLTENDLHRIVKSSVKKALREGFLDNLSPDALDDKAYMDDLFAQREKNMTDDWEMRNRRLRQKYPGKSEEWYEAMIDTFTENTIRRAVRESLNRLIETDCAGVMQTGCGNAPKGTNPEAGQYTVPLGGDEETSDRHPGFSVDGKAKWNKKGSNTSVMRRPMYKPKSGK